MSNIDLYNEKKPFLQSLLNKFWYINTRLVSSLNEIKIILYNIHIYIKRVFNFFLNVQRNLWDQVLSSFFTVAFLTPAGGSNPAGPTF